MTTRERLVDLVDHRRPLVLFTMGALILAMLTVYSLSM
jgi:hypothetical protein